MVFTSLSCRTHGYYFKPQRLHFWRFLLWGWCKKIANILILSCSIQISLKMTKKQLLKMTIKIWGRENHQERSLIFTKLGIYCIWGPSLSKIIYENTFLHGRLTFGQLRFLTLCTFALEIIMHLFLACLTRGGPAFKDVLKYASEFVICMQTKSENCIVRMVMNVHIIR